MKAQARKILALIMAMVMSLSLAAPAFATEAEEAPESSAPAAVEVEAPETEEEEKEEETLEAEEAKEEKKESKKLEVQSITYVKTITKSTDGKGFWLTTVTDGGAAVAYPTGADTDNTKYYKFEETSKYPEFVTFTTAPGTDTLIGADKVTRYTVTVDSKWLNPNNETGYITSNNRTVEGEVADTPVEKYSLEDSNIAWTEMTNLNNWFGGKRVKGWIYQEKQTGGKYRVFFKLTPVEAGHFKTSVKDSEWQYYVTGLQDEKLTRDDDIRDALGSAQLCSKTGAITAGTYVNHAATADLPAVVLDNANPDVNSEVRYSFGIQNASGVTATVNNNNAVDSSSVHTLVRLAFTGTNSNGTFELRVVKSTKDLTVSNATPVQTVVKDADDIKALLANSVAAAELDPSADKWTITGVTATSNDYFTVYVNMTGSATATLDASKFAENVSEYSVGGDYVAGLTDMSKDGYYNASDALNSKKDAVTIAANTAVLGPVVVKTTAIEKKDFLVKVAGWQGADEWQTIEAVATEAATGTTNKTVAGLFMGAHYDEGNKVYKFASLAELKTLVRNRYCIEDKNVVYTQLIMNTKKGDKTNKEATATNVGGKTYYTASGDWYTEAKLKDNADFITTGTYVAEKSVNHSKVKGTEIVDSTCKKPGSEITKVYCQICGKEFESETKTLPVKLDNLDKGNKPNYQVNIWNSKNPTATLYEDETANNGSGGVFYVAPDKSTTAVALNATFVATNYNETPGTVWSTWTLKPAGTTYTGSTHYIAKAEVAITNPTKDKAGTKTTTFTCNMGEVHDELTIVEEINKKELEHSGKWTYNAWSEPNTTYARNPQQLYGYKVQVADYDVDDATLPIITNKTSLRFVNGQMVETVNNHYFEFSAAAQQMDGTYIYIDDVMVQAGVEGMPVWTVNGAIRSSTLKKYIGTAVVKDIKGGAKDCVDGSATIEVKVFEVPTDFSYGFDANTNTEKLAAIEKKGTVVQTYTKNVVVPAEKTHVDANSDGLCDNCGNAIEQNAVTPVTGLVDISKATVTFDALTYTGKAAQPTVTVTLDGVKLAKGIDYEVEELQAVNAGTYPLVVKGKGDFSGRVVGNVTINKAASSMKIKSAPASLTSKKKKAVTGEVKMTYTNSKLDKFAVTGKVTGVSISKDGKITVKKNIKKKGTFKFKVTGKAKNANYTAPKAVTGKVTIKIGKK